MRWLGRIGAADLVTLANGFFGALAITYVLDGRHVIASLLIFMAVIMDGLDGIVARKYGSPHEFGRFLDSISDAVSFCLAPGLIIYNNFYDESLGSAWVSFQNAAATAGAMFFVVFGLLRLARFAGRDFRHRGFLGLPTPAAAMTVLSLCLLWGNETLNPFGMGAEMYWVIGVVIALALLMISDLPYPKIHGNIAVFAGAALLPGILPCIIYLSNPGYGMPYSGILLVFLFMLMGYVVGGPVHERFRAPGQKGGGAKAKA